jgi:hypothetical protein
MPFRWILVFGWLAAIALQARSQPLYDGALGTLPADQEWLYFAARGLAEQHHTGSATRLLTSADNLESAGYARQTPGPLNRNPGFNVALRLRLNSESHSRQDRAGFSLIVLAEDRWGIELGFWTNLVFAQSADPLFTHAEEASFNSTTQFHEFVLSLTGTNYTLFANRLPLLSGPVRNYTAFTGFPDVYETPDFIFLGDNTTSASADVEIAEVALVPAPVLRARGPDRLEWEGVSGQTYTVQRSAGWGSWTNEAHVHSTSTTFSYTHVASATRPYFLRVTHP